MVQTIRHSVEVIVAFWRNNRIFFLSLQAKQLSSFCTEAHYLSGLLWMTRNIAQHLSLLIEARSRQIKLFEIVIVIHNTSTTPYTIKLAHQSCHHVWRLACKTFLIGLTSNAHNTTYIVYGCSIKWRYFADYISLEFYTIRLYNLRDVYAL